MKKEEIKQDLCKLITESLLSVRLLHIKTNDGDSLPLVDLLSVGDTIKEGREEVENIVEQIYFDLDCWNIESVIQQAIADHEQSKWKKYPENKPEDGDYYCAFSMGTPDVWYYDTELGRWSINALYREVIAFRELPKPYQEDKP